MPRLDVVAHSAPQSSFDPRALPPARVEGLYVHIPFCFHKCHYCDFYSITRQTPGRMSRFVDLLFRELDIWLAAGHRVGPRSIFFGGGTPSLLPFDAMDTLLAGLRTRLDLSDLQEWTIEVNPATTDLKYLEMLRAHGVDRISMGAQSFDPAELAILERHHHPDDVLRSIELCRRAGFERLNVDLIYAIPGQDEESWARSLARAIKLQLTHYSCYNLTYEPNTPMAVKQRLGRISVVEEAIELRMLRYARQTLTAINCQPYEVSNYASPGQECRHNLLYWRGGNYLGIGPSGASHFEGIRFRNRPHLGEWETAMEQGTTAASDIEHLTPEQREGEYMMLGLRLREGVNPGDFSRKFGRLPADRFERQLDELLRQGLIEVGDTIRLTERGIPVADAVAAEFL